MSAVSKIEWTESSWNPITGCSKISDGCKNCYAYRLANRLKAMNNPRYINGFNVTVHEDLIELPLKWKKPRMIFVNSMSDIFHEKLSDNIILKLFNTMNKANWHIFQILTKRESRLFQMKDIIKWSDNIWMGVSVENKLTLNRIEVIKKIDATVKFVSFEPLLDSIGSVNLSGIHWVIVGGESGPFARPMRFDWVNEIKEQTEIYNCAFFFKQWGGVNKKKTGRLLKGQLYNEFPNQNISSFI